MPSLSWHRSPQLRRAVAVAAVVLATGGLVLYKSTSASARAFPPHASVLASGKNATSFAGPGAHGVVALSHTGVLAGQTTTLYADVRLLADRDPAATVTVRAPISLAVVLDTSGSMSGEKIEDAKRSVLRLLGDMRDDDEIALVRYSDTSELVQPLARVGVVREALSSKIRELDASGGTNIPGGLSQGLRALDESARGRVRRVVLVSDGLDSTRAQAESLARTGFGAGITVSSLGIGLDFDESYMGSIAQVGHGNFAFVKDGASLAAFLHRELEETSSTTIENARVRLELPRGLRFVSATGADATVHGDTIELAMGSLFAGDERRALVELAADGDAGGAMAIGTRASWTRVGGATPEVEAPELTLVALRDPAAVERGKDTAVLASAVSVTASRRQIEAANAYARGDLATADALSAANERELAAAAAVAPAEAAAPVKAQLEEYKEMQRTFQTAKPSSVAGRSAAKAAAAKDMSNLQRSAF
jgi:Ca-activated chloride channel family protein